MSSNHASLDSPPRANTVYVLRYQLPGKATDLDMYFRPLDARRRADKIRAKGGDAALFYADVGDWSELDT